jgi:hypothetical protein
MAEVFAMRRSHKSFVILSFLAALAAPHAAEAQPGDRPATQLFLAPTGRALPKGQGYFKATGMGMPSWQGGITDRVSVGLAVPIYGLGHVALVTPKVQVQRSEKHSTSVGAVGIITTEGSFGVAYVAHTIERDTGALHVVVMKPMSYFSELRATVFMLGGEHRLSDRVTFMTENYLFIGGPPIVSGGVRIRAPHTTWDLGLLLPTAFEYGARPAPMVNVGYKF